ncbi:MAG: hypothetical protein FWF70_03225 [Bacteroidetes bacterium]|nr:hypothetical protein [Bacteroidota bacterium]MCL1969560.1 hypothetical protein [Bacteroidota bacterium]
MKKLIFIAVVIVLTLFACNKSEMETPPPMRGSISEEFAKQPYTCLQNKYIDSVLVYELGKQEQKYSPNQLSYDEKLEIILLLDSIKKGVRDDETNDDIAFYENLVQELMFEINSHPYVKEFVKSLALKENYDPNDMMVYTGYSEGCDVISKFQILQYYENGVDIIAHDQNYNNLTGEEEWDLFPDVNPILKAVRYTLHAKRGNNTVEYMWNGTSSSVKTKTLSAISV